MKRRAHLVGSIGLKDRNEVFTTISEILGECCPRIPDGETGDRGYWIRWQRRTFATHASFAAILTTRSLPGYKDNVERTFFALKNGIDPDTVDLGELGYANEAIESYKSFSHLIAEGTIPDSIRFQVAIPTPMALLCGFIVPEERSTLEPAVERAIDRELEKLQKSIPGKSLSIQWDVCHEVVGAAGGLALPYDRPIEGAVARIARLCGRVDAGVELGVHLCYGDPGHKHIIEPADLEISVAFANGICRSSPRPVDFVHMPVPRDRTDDAYYAPLKKLALHSPTRLILGLVHYTDGVAGSRKRIAAAERHVKDFDIATECGFGRRDPSTIMELLRIHRELCAP
jgi:hypothetical protein